MSDDHTLREALIVCRAERKLTLEDVAKQIGMTRGGLSQFETGKTRPRRTTRYQLVKFLRKYGYVVPEEEAA